MVRGRVKGKKQNIITAREDPGSSEGHKIPPNRRRGRPQKPLKDDIGEGKTQKIQDEDEKSHISREVVKTHSSIENGTKRKRDAHVNENLNSIQEENSMEIKSSLDNPTESVGFRQSGSRRKNKPHRAAEAGVQCK
ncbi:hypothetical protein RchiOBHm_Chr3g0480181 [Rosa chinensis]|uniref:Uncharacterized protein n=1 Tax=Rosa chinensis TaxID=74649 RepID=A0A2P6RDL9_ROSCH|nr:uncharacterized protein LOC112191425 [Rosa chinensis]PRQ44521.1 hypothetical protein RchiOBHm_Chr3g0480181 [Rosa chinensis]